MKALIDENKVVVQVEQQEFDVAEPCFWVNCTDNIIAYQYKYENGEIVPIVRPQRTAEQNKLIAKKLLQDSDWTALPDVNLANKTEWETYRSVVRNIANNPPEGDVSWPAVPLSN